MSALSQARSIAAEVMNSGWCTRYWSTGVNLRGMTDYNIAIYCDSKVIGELDPIGARGSLYKDAIYQHLGKRYISTELDLPQKLCRVKPIEVDYYTEASWEKRITLNDIQEKKSINGHLVQFGYINVNKQPKLYKKIKEKSYENIGYGPITLPPFEYDTTGFCIAPSKKWQMAQHEVDKRYVGASLYGFSYILKRVGPSLCMGDVNDIDTDVSLSESEEEKWESALYLYDTIEGGVGYGEKIFELLSETLQLCLQVINECECSHGCPACVPPLPPGVENNELADFLIESNGAVACTSAMLHHLLSGKITMPKINTEKRIISSKISPVLEDMEKLKNVQRLKKAAKLLKKKRERQH